MVANSICNRLHKLITRYVSTEKFIRRIPLFCGRINKKPGYGLRISSYFYYLWLKIEIILMNKPQITIKDIARALNVSPSTVSRALKDNPDISRETRDLIHAYAREHNYKPNVLAVNLRSSRSNNDWT